jgi:hypothetical protein
MKVKNIKINFGKYLFILILGIGTYLAHPIIKDVFLLIINFPIYLKFDSQANQLNSRFDTMNDEIFKILPNPYAGSRLKQRKIEGTHPLGSLYGQELILNFELNESQNYQLIMDYYKKYLVSREWSANEYYARNVLFTKGTSCINVDPFPIENKADQEDMTDNYTISIYHDFFKQNFSPTFPDFPTIRGLNAFSIYTLGETKFVLCNNDFEPPIK